MVDPGLDSEVKVDMVVPGMVDQELMLEFGMLGLFAREARDSAQADQGKLAWIQRLRLIKLIRI